MTKREATLALTLVILTGVAVAIPRIADAKRGRPSMTHRSVPRVCSGETRSQSKVTPLSQVLPDRSGIVSPGFVEPPSWVPCITPAGDRGSAAQPVVPADAPKAARR